MSADPRAETVSVRLNLTKRQARKMGRVHRWEEESAFGAWIDDLRERVIKGDYGYEPGEFTVYPEQWRSLWRERLTPDAAFKRALDAFGDERAEQDRQQAENWARIQEEDAALRARSATETSNV